MQGDVNAAQQKPEFQHSLIRAIQDASPDGILVVNDEGAIVSYNRKFLEIWQIPPGDLPEINRFIEPHGELDASNHCEIELKDGRTIERHSAAVPGAGGECLGRVWFFRDITAPKEAELELESTRAPSGAAQHAKSRFLANMSHEIRTPMNGVLGMIDLLLETDLTEKQRRYATVAKSSGRTLLALIDGILDLAKIEAHKIVLENAPFCLHDTIEDTLELMRVQASEKGLAIHSEIAPETPKLLHGDRHRLRQVLLNLGENAIKFTERGEVRLAVTPEQQADGRITLRFSVSDTGIGIRPEQAETLFAPFVQADTSSTRKYGGAGLGLAISKQLVELMHGRIGVESREEQNGSTFWFTADFGREASCEPNATSERPVRAARARETGRVNRTERILVVEDNSINREVALAQLHILGYEADVANNGAEAVRSVQQKNYDLVLMDCEMPVMDGYEATGRIRLSRRADIPIIALTAGAMRADQERCLKAGMNDYVAKPVDLGALRSVLAKWLPETSTAAAKQHTETPESAPAEVHESTLQTSAKTEALTSSRVLDTEKLMAHVNGDIGLLRRLVAIFDTQIAKRMEAIRQAIAGGNAAMLAKEAHAVKGAISNFCCEAATNAAARLEMLGRGGEIAQAQECLMALDRAIAELTPELKSLIKS